MNLQSSESKLLSELHNSSLTLVSHDAGGANVLDAFVRANNLIPNFAKLLGPAIKIFNFKEQIYDTKKGSDKPEIVLSTTGWQTDFEFEHIKDSIEQEGRIVVFLDSWTNFRERILGIDGLLAVSEFVTFDSIAKEIATKVFPHAKIYQFPNYYLIEQGTRIRMMRGLNEGFDIDYLYIGEPIRNKMYSEIDAIMNFLKKIELNRSESPNIAIRPHPSESRETYLAIASSQSRFSIFVTGETSLAEDLSRTKFVVGCNSMALEMAHLSGIPVYCAIPEPFKSEIPFTFFNEWNSI